ncbi:glycosyltransferase family 2 protein [Paludifilum halophilum]|uniref:Glycosyltransferase 2-like domain-containing protein n=1 Tax=Paludifilum halophilum TaxID=1642702 RepID=A0A235B5T9_9BACL|nr:glycosyltransferase [Paludifilum halophilum]OYD07591.1 hypothetical protein CHM34_08885 [Paludifilum halophilum]
MKEHGWQLVWSTLETASLLFFVAFSLFWFVFRPLSVLTSGLAEQRKKKRYIPIVDAGVSVILPCHNEEETIEEAVQSILNQSISYPLEIIVVENNSTDNTMDVLRHLEKKYPEVRAASILTRRGHCAVSEAMNHGISLAKKPIVVRLDADTQLGTPTALEEAVTPIVQGKAVATCCNVRITNPTTTLERLQAIEYFFAMELDRRSQVVYDSVLCCSGAMSAFQLDALKAVGGYHTNPNISEDMEITLKMHKMGRVAVNQRAISFTDAPRKTKVLAKQRYIWMLYGIICLFVHRKQIGDQRFGRRGLVGLIGLPLKVVQTYQAFVGIAVKAVGAFLISGDSIEEMIWSFGLLSAVHVIVTGMIMAIVSLVAYSRQGVNYWYLLPLFSLVYQPFLALVRFWGTLAGLWIILKDSGSRTRLARYDEDHTGPAQEYIA